MKPLEPQADAYKLYLQGNLTIPDISEKCGVPVSTLKNWIKDDGWRERKNDLNDSVMTDVETELREKSGAIRFEFLDRELEICRELETRMLATLKKRKEDGSPSYLANRELAILSKALKDTGERVAGLLGLDRKGTDEDTQSLLGARMLVVVGSRPRELKAHEKAQELDITTQVLVSAAKSKPKPF